MYLNSLYYKNHWITLLSSLTSTFSPSANISRYKCLDCKNNMLVPIYYFSSSFWSVSISLLAAAIYTSSKPDFPQFLVVSKSRWWKKVYQRRLWACLSYSTFSCLSVLLVPAPFTANCLPKEFLFVPLFAFFLYHIFFGSFPCSLLTPGDISWPPHISFSLPQLLLFFPYMVSPGVVTAHFWTFTRFVMLNEQLLWLNTYGGIPCVTSLCCFPQQWLDNVLQFERPLNKH